MSYRIHTNRLYIGLLMTSRILVVEDDKRLAATLERVLTAEGHQVELVGDGLEALRRAREQPFDLVVLDIMLPSLDGVAVCRRLRATGQVPILLLTALGGTDERVRGLDAGADDYLVKPFAYEELLARVRALRRRAGPHDHLRFGDLLLEPQSRGAWRGKRSMTLTATEFDLLQHFLRHPRQVLTRDQLLDAVWKGEPESDNVVAVYIGYLRQKLEEGGEPRLLHTVRGTGYALRE
jgi:two-component system response regulator MprA